MTTMLLALVLSAAAAQADTLHLAEVHAAAVAGDPRARQARLRADAAALRLRNLAAEALPLFTGRGQATYQSEVAGLPIVLPNVDVPEPPMARFEAALGIEQRLLDPTARPRRELERARLAAEVAALESALYPLATEVNEAFFAALLLQNRQREMAVLTEDLRARLGLVRAQAREGAALPGDTAIVAAELLRVGQDAAQLAAERDAALAVLGRLAGFPVSPDDLLAVPDFTTPTPPVPGRAHPQYALYAARREQLARQAEVISAGVRPQLSAFGEVGYGRPGPRQFTDEPHEYWSAGVRVRWTPWSWGSPERDRELLAIEQRIIETEEAALDARLERAVRGDLARIERLQGALASDDAIIALREQVERQARAQLEERAITPAAYLSVRGDLQAARLAKQGHLVELAAAQAGYRTTLGLPLR